jgi:hypothetical protein
MSKTTIEGAQLEEIKISQEILDLLVKKHKRQGGDVLNILSICLLQLFYKFYSNDAELSETVAFVYVKNLEENFKTFFKDMKFVDKKNE